MMIDFGQYKGKDLSEIPSDYLKWVSEKVTNRPDIQKAAVEELVKRETPNDYNTLVFGKNPQQRITSIYYDTSCDELMIWGGDKLVSQIYQPYVLSNQPSNNFQSIRLKGDQYYKYLTHVDMPTYDRIKKSWDRSFYLPRSIEEGFMLLNGYTYYKGLNPQDLKLFSFDIETTTLNPYEENAKVLLISTTARTADGNLVRRLFSLAQYGSDEEKMIAEFCNYLTDFDPDVLLGHNVFMFDLPYLYGRYGDKLPIGKQERNIQFDDYKSKFRKDGSQQYEYLNVRCPGREIVDTFFLSIKYDIGRTFPSYGLKAIEKYLKLVDDNRVEWDFKKHSPKKYISWDQSVWDSFCIYCEQDADSPIKLYDYMIPTFFYLANVIPKTMQEIINQASGSQLDSFMIRAYLQDGYSQPRTSEKEGFEGAISFGIPGVYKNVFSVDFHALYPSIIKAYKLCDSKKDPKAYLLEATRYFTEKRVEYKELFKKTGESKYDGMQQSQKVLANSIYGFLAAGFLLYNSPKISATVTKIGRGLLDTICKEATGKSIHQWKKLVKEEENAESYMG